MQLNAGDMLIDKLISSYKSTHYNYKKKSDEKYQWTSILFMGILAAPVFLLLSIFVFKMDTYEFLVLFLAAYSIPIGGTIHLKYKISKIRGILNAKRSELNDIGYVVAYIKASMFNIELKFTEQKLLPDSAELIPLKRDPKKSFRDIIDFKKYDEAFEIR